MSRMPTREQHLRPGARRPHHPRARRHPHGQRSEHVGAQQELPGARLPERLRRRRRPVRVAARQELHVDDPRDVDADERLHRQRAQGGEDLMENEHRSRRRDARPSIPAQDSVGGAGGGQLCADRGRGAGGARPCGRRRGSGAADRRGLQAEVLHARTSTRRCASCRSDHPGRRAVGQRDDAGVPEFMDFTMIDQPARQVAMRGGLAWLDLECQRRFDQTFVGAPPRQRHRDPRRLATYGELKPGLPTARRSSAASAT